MKWSQGYQSEIVAADATFAMGNDHVSGLTIWQMTDIKANIGDTKECGACDYAPHPNNITVPWNCASSSDRCGRPRGENNKGGGEHGRLRASFLETACLNTLALCRSGFLEKEETNVGLPRQDLQGHALKNGECRANAKRRFPTTQTASLRQTRSFNCPRAGSGAPCP